MKNEYEVKSNRYGHIHKLVKIKSTDYYSFIPEKDWMPIRIIYEDDTCRQVKFIDSEGGPCIGVGWRNNEIEVAGIESLGNIIMFTLKEI